MTAYIQLVFCVLLRLLVTVTVTLRTVTVTVTSTFLRATLAQQSKISNKLRPVLRYYLRSQSNKRSKGCTRYVF